MHTFPRGSFNEGDRDGDGASRVIEALLASVGTAHAGARINLINRYAFENSGYVAYCQGDRL
jgi:hypothetical protein